LTHTTKTQFVTEEGSLAIYLKEIGKNRNLSPAEEAEVAVRIRVGDQKALEKLVKANLRFVVSVSRNYQNQGLPLSDLINEGNLGLIRAAKRFDEKKNFKFISYAVWWIRQAILQALAEQSRIIKLPLNRVGTIHKIGKTQGRLEQQFRRMPNVREIAQELNITENDVKETIKIGNSHMSLDAPIQDGQDSKLLDIFIDNNQEQPDHEVLERSLKAEIDKTLDTLTVRERKVLMMYFGIGDETAHTLEEIGQRFSLTRERARQIKEKAIGRLKRSSRCKTLMAYRCN
jgi:RNA polymerase primary sigma factor